MKSQVVVEGRLECSIAQLERGLLVRISELQDVPNSDTHLIALLCNSVRLCRMCSMSPPTISFGLSEEAIHGSDQGTLFDTQEGNGPGSEKWGFDG